MTPIEILGPGSFDAWRLSYGVFLTGMIMLDAIDMSLLVNYTNKIAGYVARFGGAWPLVYQTDARARSERLSWLMTEALAQHEEDEGHGRRSSFDPLRPWNRVWQIMVNDLQYWQEELVEPCILYMARTHKLDQFVAGDMPVEGGPSSSSSSRAPPLAIMDRDPPPNKETTGRGDY